MAPLPTPALIIIATALESLVAVNFLAQYIPGHGLLIVFSTLLALHFGLFAFYCVFIYPFFVSPLRHLPQPKGALPILGHGLAMFSRPPGREFAKWMAEVPNEGLIYVRGFFNADGLLVTDVKVLGEILVTKSYEFEKPPAIRNFLRKVLGDGLIVVEGDEHRFLRKTMMPTFAFRHIKDLYPIFWNKSLQLADGVKEQMVGNLEHNVSAEKSKIPAGEATSVVEVNHWANQVTMDIIGLAAMGKDLQALENGNDPLIVNYEELLEPVVEKQLYFAANLLMPPRLLALVPWKMNQRMNAIARNLTAICLQLVKDKKEEINVQPDGHKDILSLLIRSGGFSDGQLVDQMLTFLAAGHETTSSAFTWTTFLLAKHPTIQTALRAELYAALPTSTSISSADLSSTLESLPLLNGICNEVLRLYPTVPATVRTPLVPRMLAGHLVPAGTEILLVPSAINRLPSLWGSNADEFVPERWIDTDEKGERRPNNSGGAPSNYALLTFLHGPRSCIGQGFAKAELRALVAVFCGRFEMEMEDPDEVVVPHGVITTKPKNGMRLRLRALEGW